jgi:serine/threonine-protein kinase
MENEQLLAAGAILEKRYHIRGLLGQGGMSRVYLADALHLEMQVAVKENLQSGADARAQFEREARLLARLAHSNIPRVLDSFVDPTTNRQYLVMEYIAGEDLAAMIKRVGPLPETTALAWIRQILDAVEYLHNQHPPIIHRDIKPANIKITPQGKAVLVDFGISKFYDPSRGTMTGMPAVTAGYAPPEQYGFRTTHRSDIYSLGATLYTMVTGQIPPEAPLRQANEEALIPPRQLATVSTLAENTILRALQVDNTKRWQSIPELRAALEGKLPTIADDRSSQTMFVPQRRGPSPVYWIVSAGGLAIVLLICGLVLTLLSATPTPAPVQFIAAPTLAIPIPSPVPTSSVASIMVVPTSTTIVLSTTPTWTPIRTEIAIATRTWTSNPTATSTVRINPVQLVAPVDGAIISVDNVVLRWEWDSILKVDETFEIVAWPENRSEQISIGSTRERSILIDLLKWKYAGTVGKFLWLIRIKRSDGTLLNSNRATFVIAQPTPAVTPERDEPDKPDKPEPKEKVPKGP